MEKIRVDDMHLHYGDYHALRGVSISFSDREITALIGPSGCGKSTLLKSLNRMNDLVGGLPHSGTDSAGRPGHLRRHGREPAEKERISSSIFRIIYVYADS
ncbi:MAG: ATP-binding cassette domain-containing protein [Treponema sp.]|nr:ATP-binding cassette domain-containing protein [Treponema sp.]MDY3754700.1 ATP-binding cassette domain-containing protein [Treponema sp.]MDY4673616.1 ATP-binding cassette domain-containing protein [Treponema sp.]